MQWNTQQETNNQNEQFRLLKLKTSGDARLKNIMFILNACKYNRGSEAIIRGFASIVKEAIPDSRIILSSAERDFDSTQNIPHIDGYVMRYSFNHYSLKHVVMYICKKLVKNLRWAALMKYSRLIRECRTADIIVFVGADNFDKSYGMFHEIHEMNKTLRSTSSAKMVMYDCSLEPSEIDDNIRQDFELFDVITARENITFEAFKKSDFQKPLFYYPDPAFAMAVEKTPLPDGFLEGKTIGVNASALVTRAKYGSDESTVLRSYVKMIESILAATDNSVMLLPHVMHGTDLPVLEKIHEFFSTNNRVFLMGNESLNASQLKYLISKCRLFVGARTHSTIAAYSSCVPTLVLGYSVKSSGIAGDIFGTDEGYVIPLKMLKSDNMLADAFFEIYNRQDEIKAHLESIMPCYINKACQIGSMINEIENICC